jgi:7-cyano-7-deazaguanine reductase
MDRLDATPECVARSIAEPFAVADFKHLGRPSNQPVDKVDLIDWRGGPVVVRLDCREFTSLCPVTGQPDFAHLVIDYAPGDWLVESKSLKLYLTSFRNHGAFHEDCTVSIGKKIFDFTEATWLRISGYWYPRGGIPIDVFWQSGEVPKGLYVPDTGVASYRGRG